jgi:hypothetical protein
MHKQNVPVERRLEATFLNEQATVKQLPSTDRSNPTSDPLRLSIEMAVEWAHLGGD